MINTAIAKLAAGQNLAGTETREAFDQIMSGGATNAQIAAFITAMRMKGETIDEITACAQVLREKCSRIHTKGDVLDIVGTGGDCANTFNISTTSAFVISAAGQPVAKHGNRSVSSKRDAVVLNSAVSLYLGGKGSIKECAALAEETIDSGRAYEKLQQLVKLSNM